MKHLESLTKEELIEEIVRLNELLFPDDRLGAMHYLFGLTTMQSKFLNMLLRRAYVSGEQFATLIGGDSDVRTVTAHICNLRRRMRQHGIVVPKCRPGNKGLWSLPRTTKQEIEMRMELYNADRWQSGRDALPSTSKGGSGQHARFHGGDRPARAGQSS